MPASTKRESDGVCGVGLPLRSRMVSLVVQDAGGEMAGPSWILPGSQTTISMWLRVAGQLEGLGRRPAHQRHTATIRKVPTTPEIASVTTVTTDVCLPKKYAKTAPVTQAIANVTA
jgi:hypothetical protein